MPFIGAQQAPGFPWRPGVTARWLVNRQRGSQALSVHYAEAQRQTGSPLHTHRVEEVFYVLEGRLEVRLGEGRHILGPGEAALVPPEVAHAWGNPGPDTVRYLAIHAHKDAFAPGVTTYLEGSPPATPVGERPPGEA